MGVHKMGSLKYCITMIMEVEYMFFPSAEENEKCIGTRRNIFNV